MKNMCAQLKQTCSTCFSRLAIVGCIRSNVALQNALDTKRVGPVNKVGPPYASACINMHSSASVMHPKCPHMPPCTSIMQMNVNLQHTFARQYQRTIYIILLAPLASPPWLSAAAHCNVPCCPRSCRLPLPTHTQSTVSVLQWCILLLCSGVQTPAPLLLSCMKHHAESGAIYKFLFCWTCKFFDLHVGCCLMFVCVSPSQFMSSTPGPTKGAIARPI